jgi:hypothetical protein
VRLSEKTLELNFCAQARARLGRPAFWFGLTQRQEARAGFDAAARLGGRVILLQFKASNTVLATGARRFHLNHRQLDALRTRAAGSRRRSAFYVLPSLGETSELPSANWDILKSSWLLDVTELGGLGPPTKRKGTLRQTERHYADLSPPHVTVHSDPVTAEVISADLFFSRWSARH